MEKLKIIETEGNSKLDSDWQKSLCKKIDPQESNKITLTKDQQIVNAFNYTTNNDDVIICEIEHEEKYLTDNSPTDVLKILEYNIDKNGLNGDGPYEKGFEPIIEALKQFQKSENPDVIILVEVARNCYKFGQNNLGQLLGEALNMNFFYAVENLYIDNSYITHNKNESYKNSSMDDSIEQSVGNLILTKRKVLDYDVKYFKNNCCGNKNIYNIKNFINIDVEFYVETNKTKDEDIVLTAVPIRITGTHLEAGQSSVLKTIQGAITRKRQISEIVEYNETIKDKFYDFIIAGDMNSPFMSKDPFLWPVYHTYNYFDAFSKIPYFQRNTCPWSSTGKYYFGNLDYIFTMKNDACYDSEILNEKSKFNYFYGLSDHHPIYTKYKIDNSHINSNIKKNSNLLNTNTKKEKMNKDEALISKGFLSVI